MQPGDRVGVMLDNSVEFLLLALALGRIGAVFVPLNLALKGPSLAHPIRRSGISTLAIEPGLVLRVAENRDSLPDLHTPLVREPFGAGASASTLRVIPLGALAVPTDIGPLPAEPSAFEPWSVMFTSGTTGPAKGAVMTHQYWYTVPAELSGAARDVREDDVFYVSSPMFHAAAGPCRAGDALAPGRALGGRARRGPGAGARELLRPWRSLRFPAARCPLPARGGQPVIATGTDAVLDRGSHRVYQIPMTAHTRSGGA